MGRPPTYKTPEAKAESRRQNLKRHAKTAAFKATQERWLARPENKRKHKSAQLKCKFGITLDQWEAIFALQGQRCASCKSVTPNHKQGWATDHCHTTGVVRGILCQPCNLALGAIKEDIRISRALTAYLELVCLPIKQKYRGQ